MRHWIRLLTVTIMAIGLAACQSDYRFGPRHSTDAVEGFWLDPHGIQSSFTDGTFQTRTTDTNTLLATGKYTMINPSLVQIDVRSLLRNTNSRVNCSLVSPTQLNCTSSDGNQFTLLRRLG